jgi:hypothetical protein
MRTLSALVILTLTLAACGDDDGAAADARTPDAALPDAGQPDAALSDAGQPDAAGPDAGPLACPDLDLHDCRLRADCAADICPSCTCAPTFEGCRDVADPAPGCPDLACPTPQCCDGIGDCPQGDCAAPGTPHGCGMCNPEPGDCTADGDCNVGEVCEPMACSCEGQRVCTSGCTVGPADPCALGTTCDGEDHPRCQPSDCDALTPCPPDFDCDAGACTRRSCVADVTCDGWCVLGFCYDGYGECRLPVP